MNREIDDKIVTIACVTLLTLFALYLIPEQEVFTHAIAVLGGLAVGRKS